ncbi:hypothetical protein ACNKHO_17380 [Shigella flexneri]
MQTTRVDHVGTGFSFPEHAGQHLKVVIFDGHVDRRSCRWYRYGWRRHTFTFWLARIVVMSRSEPLR